LYIAGVMVKESLKSVNINKIYWKNKCGIVFFGTQYVVIIITITVYFYHIKNI